MKKRRGRRTPEERAAEHATALLETRIAALDAELDAAGSVYARVGRTDQLRFALRRLEAELAPGT